MPRQTVPKRPAGAFLSSLAAVQVSAPPPERFSPRFPRKKPPHALHQLFHKIHGLFLPFANCFSSAAPTITETLSRHARSLEKLVPIRPVFLFCRRGVPAQDQAAKQPLLSPAGQAKIFAAYYVRARDARRASASASGNSSSTSPSRSMALVCQSRAVLSAVPILALIFAQLYPRT